MVNVSFGAEYALNETYAAYLGFWTDFSPITSQQFRDIDRSGQGFVLATGDVDLYHVVVGATRTTKRSTIAAGVVVSQGTGTAPSNADITATNRSSASRCYSAIPTSFRGTGGTYEQDTGLEVPLLTLRASITARDVQYRRPERRNHVQVRDQ